MAKRFWVVLDSDMDARIERDTPQGPRNKFYTRGEAEAFASSLVRDLEADFHIAEVIALATAPKAPVAIIELAA